MASMRSNIYVPKREILLPPSTRRSEVRRASFLNAGPQHRAYNLFLGSTGSGGASDPLYPQTLLIANNQESFTDNSASARTLTAMNGTFLSESPADVYFGSTAAWFDGLNNPATGDYVTVTPQIQINPTTDWTAEFLFRTTDEGYSGGIAGLRGFFVEADSGGSNYITRSYYYDNVLTIARGVHGVTTNSSTYVRNAALIPLINTWYFLQMVNDATANTFTARLAPMSSGVFTTIGVAARIGFRMDAYGAGYNNTGPDNFFQGPIQQCRVTTAIRDFAIPTASFPTS